MAPALRLSPRSPWPLHAILAFAALGPATGINVQKKAGPLPRNATLRGLDADEGSLLWQGLSEATAPRSLPVSLSQLGGTGGLEGRAAHHYFMNLELQSLAWHEAAKVHGEKPQDFVEGKRIYTDRMHHGPRKVLPKPRLTLFKGLFGLAFILALVATCFARLFEASPDAVPKGSQASGSTPSPPSEATPAARSTQLVKATVTVCAWMLVSVGFIIFNKHMFTVGGFPYPVTLTAMHMGSCYVVFGFVRLLPPQWRSAVMPDADKHIPMGLYVKGLVPAALLMAVCLGVGNLGFLYATVAFIQMVKPVNIVVTSLAGFAWGLEPATPTHIFIAVLVSGGVAIAAACEVQFSLAGLICQLAASTSEGLRLIILQGIMQGSLKLDPLTTLYRFTPVAGLALVVLSCFLEAPVNWASLKMPGLLVINCFMAVALNMLIAAVVHQTSAVVFVLAGVTKDIATIAISALMYRTPITGQEVGGYAISMLGICLFKVYKDNLRAFQERGMFGGFSEVLSKAFMPAKS